MNIFFSNNYYSKIYFCMIIFYVDIVDNFKEKQLHIGAVFPMSGDWAGGISCRPAAIMALNDVNNQTDILPDYNLTMTMKDSQCIAGLGSRMMYELIYTPPVKIMFLTGCSTVTTFVAEAAPRWNLIVMAFGASSPALSNRARFPSFFRTHPSASLQNPTRLKLLKRWGWKKVSLIWEMEEVFSSTIHDFEMSVKELNITIVKRQPLQKHSQAVYLALKSLKNKDARIIIGLFYEKLARKVFCEAYKLGLYGAKVVWVIIGWYPDDWWKYHLKKDGINCTEKEMKMAVEGHITTESLMWNNDDAVTFSGLTSRKFKDRLINMLKDQWRNPENKISEGLIKEKLSQLTKISGYAEAPLAYDAIWAIAIALDKAAKRLKSKKVSLSEFEYHIQPNEIYEELHRAMNETYFMGVSTLVYFDSSGNRISWTRIEQMINGSYHVLGHHHILTDNLTLLKEPTWTNSRIPRDSVALIFQRRALPLSIYIGFCCLVLICIISGVVCIYFVHRCAPSSMKTDDKLKLKLLCSIGCLLNMFVIILLGADRISSVKIKSNTLFMVLCQLKVAFVCLGFSLGYGSLFLSIWIVYRVATDRKKLTTDRCTKNKCGTIEDSFQIKDKLLKIAPVSKIGVKYNSWEVIGMLGSFCMADVVVLLAWRYFDPLSRYKVYFNQEKDILDEDIHYQPYMEICDCRNLGLWLGIIFGWKGLVLILGLLLSYETRNIKFSFAIDTRSTGMAVYNVVVLSLITAPVSVMIKDKQSAHFVFVSTSILLTSALSLGLIYIPRIKRQFRKTGDQDENIISDDETIQLRKTEEEQHNKYFTENEQLKRQISQIEREIEHLKSQLTNVYDVENLGISSQSIVAIHGGFSSYENLNHPKNNSFNRKKLKITGKIKSERKTLLKHSFLTKQQTIALEKEFNDKFSGAMESTSGVYSEFGMISI